MDGCFALVCNLLRVMLKLHEKSANRGCFLSSRLAMRNKKRGDFGVVVCCSLCFDLQKAKINCAGNSLSLSLFFFSPSLD